MRGNLHSNVACGLGMIFYIYIEDHKSLCHMLIHRSGVIVTYRNDGMHGRRRRRSSTIVA
jgi:hypothetical protein